MKINRSGRGYESCFTGLLASSTTKDSGSHPVRNRNGEHFSKSRDSHPPWDFIRIEFDATGESTLQEKVKA